MTRRLLGRFAIDAQLEADLARANTLELHFGEAYPDATVDSLDGNLTIAWLAPSGAIAALLVQDYVPDESRLIPFPFGDIEIVAEPGEVAVYLVVP